MPRASRAWLSFVVGATTIGAALFGVSYVELRSSQGPISLGPQACDPNSNCNSTTVSPPSLYQLWFLLTGVGAIVLFFGIVSGIAVALDVHERRVADDLRAPRDPDQYRK